MRMLDRHVRTHTNVRHILDLKKNLLSLGALNAQECKFLGADGGIKVTKGSMIILIREWTANLYKMIRSVIFCDASATTEKDTTKLWHKSLRHMSERGLQALHNKRVLPDIRYCKLGLYRFCIMVR